LEDFVMKFQQIRALSVAALVTGLVLSSGVASTYAQAVSAGQALNSGIRVISYNAQFLPGIGELFNYRVQPEYRAERIGTLLAAYDVIGLSEMFELGRRRTVLETIAEQWEGSIHTVAVSPEKRSRFGIDSGLVVVRRWPIIASHDMTFGNDSSVETYGLLADGFAAKGALHARIRMPADERGEHNCIEVFLTHLESRDVAIRIEQYAMLAEFVGKWAAPDNPVLILGDLNTDGGVSGIATAEPDYRRMLDVLIAALGDRGLQDLWVECGQGSGATCDFNEHGGKRLDYILLSNGNGCARPLRATNAKVNHFEDARVGALSDHSAVEAELAADVALLRAPGAGK
jgi:endonuclease/exonuclease/phosphatase family metal-dependent hydrolase